MIIDLRENGLAALNGGRESLLTFSFIFVRENNKASNEEKLKHYFWRYCYEKQITEIYG